MKLNATGGLLQVNVGSHHGPPQIAIGNGGSGGWSYMMPATPDGGPVTSSSNFDETALGTTTSLQADIPPDLTELKSLYPTTTEYQLTSNDPTLPQFDEKSVRQSTATFHANPSGGNGNEPAVFDLVSSSTQLTPMLNSTAIKSELADYLLNSDIDDIAALIGNAIADSTVPTAQNMDDCGGGGGGGVTSSTIDPWTELDAWIESACVIQPVHSSTGNNNNFSGKPELDKDIHATADFHPTLQTLLQNDIIGPPQSAQHIYHDQQQSKAHEHNFPSSILQTRLQQPPMRAHGDSHARHSPQLPESTTSMYGGLKVDPYDPDSPPFDHHGPNGLGSNEVQRPHTTHVSPPAIVTSTMGGGGRYRKSFNQRKNYDGFLSGGYSNDFSQGAGNVSKLASGMKKPPRKNKMGTPTSNCQQSMELIENGKEKPIHRCGICNRGFLNKSNIKVHLRTHTGEKPFKCDTCGKAFRQKAHLLKHVQIHKRLPRD